MQLRRTWLLIQMYFCFASGLGRDVIGTLAGVPISDEPITHLTNCSSDYQCSFSYAYTPLCEGGVCEHANGFRDRVGQCTCDVKRNGVREALTLPVLKYWNDTQNLSTCFQQCTEINRKSKGKCHAVQGVFVTKKKSFDCTLLGVPDGCETGECHYDGDGTRASFCYHTVPPDAKCENQPRCSGNFGYCCPTQDNVMRACCGGTLPPSSHWPENHLSFEYQVAVAVGAAVLVCLSCLLSARQRSRFTIRRRHEERKLQFTRSVEDIRMNVDAGRNAMSFMPGSDGDPSLGLPPPRLSYDDMVEDRTICRNKTNSVRPAELASLHEFYNTWLTTREPPCYILAFVNAKSGNQSAKALIREFNRAFETGGSIQSERELGSSFGKVCELNLPGSIEKAFTDLEEVCRVSQRNKIRLLVCGGDGTVTWVLTESRSA